MQAPRGGGATHPLVPCLRPFTVFLRNEAICRVSFAFGRALTCFAKRSHLRQKPPQAHIAQALTKPGGMGL